MTPGWRPLEQELSRILKSRGCHLEHTGGEVWLTALPEDAFDWPEGAPVSLTTVAQELDRLLHKVPG